MLGMPNGQPQRGLGHTADPLVGQDCGICKRGVYLLENLIEVSVNLQIMTQFSGDDQIVSSQYIYFKWPPTKSRSSFPIL